MRYQWKDFDQRTDKDIHFMHSQKENVYKDPTAPYIF